MTKRKTHCLTWGETKGVGERYGAWRVCTQAYITLCGAEDTEDTSELPCDLNPGEPRPKGICRECWKEYRNQMLSVLFCEECPPV